MIDWLVRHRFGVAVAVLLTAPLLLMYFHGRRGEGVTFAERLTVTLAGASQALANAVVDFGGGLFRDYALLVGVHEENERLVRENERLLGEAVQAKRLAVEIQTLREALGFRERRKDLRLWPGRVIGRELTPYYRVARVSVEVEGDGEVRSGMAVLTHAGLVGRVVRGVGSYADVMLLTDGRSRVAGEVLGRGVLGMAVGTGRTDEYRVRFQVSISETPLEEGAVVVTSGHDRVFPRGIEIGYVTNAANRRQVGPFVEYDLAPAVNPANVEFVFVAEGGATGDPRGGGRGSVGGP